MQFKLNVIQILQHSLNCLTGDCSGRHSNDPGPLVDLWRPHPRRIRVLLCPLQAWTKVDHHQPGTNVIKPFCFVIDGPAMAQCRDHCTIDLLFDWFGLVCFANKNTNCQLSYNRFQTSQTGGQQPL
jgi:hypothetical protein